MRKAFVYRLYPTTNQLRELGIMLETHRRLYNEALAQRKNAYETSGKTTKYSQQSAWYKSQRLTNPFYARLNFSSAQATLRRLDRAYTAFFRRAKKGDKPGYPRFKARERFHSFLFPSHGDGVRLNGNRLRVQHVGVIKVKLHRPVEGQIKTISLHQELGKWYVVVSCDLGTVAVPPSKLPAVGVDVGVEAFLTTSEGERVDNPRLLRKRLTVLRRAQRKMARRKKGGANRRKASRTVARLHVGVRNQRKDFHHKTARWLVSRFGLIAVESLNIRGMTRNHRLAQAIADVAWGNFLLLLKSRAESAGVEVVEVNCRGTSQECSGCGKVVQKSLGVRQHNCSWCGLNIHRDINAARNILARARAARTGPLGVKLDTGPVCPGSHRL